MADNQPYSVFEKNHRFFGWASLVMAWVYTILTNIYDATNGKWDRSGVYVVRQQAFWYIIGMTLLSVPLSLIMHSPALTTPR